MNILQSFQNWYDKSDLMKSFILYYFTVPNNST